jgi:hypothetical protein
MNTLIIHPEDCTTEFLKSIYADIPSATVVTGEVTREQLKGLVRSNDRVMMMGHGTENGLLSVGHFPEMSMHVVDDAFVDLLRGKRDSVFIWCHAWFFLQRHQLHGFACDMFISEIAEARAMGVSANSEQVEESNKALGRIAGMHIHKETVPLFDSVTEAYRDIAETNPVAAYNLERLNVYTGEEACVRA